MVVTRNGYFGEVGCGGCEVGDDGGVGCGVGFEVVDDGCAGCEVGCEVGDDGCVGCGVCCEEAELARIA